MQIILASQSLFRKKALDILGLGYLVVPSHFDERSLRNTDPFELAKQLSEAKAREVGKANEGIIIAADLFVALNGKVYEKPDTSTEAIAMLNSFSGKVVEVISGLAVYNSSNEKMLSGVDACKVKFRSLEEGEINDYVSRYPVTKFAGGFDCDGVLRFAEHIEGNNFQAGMSVNRLIIYLREQGVKV